MERSSGCSRRSSATGSTRRSRSRRSTTRSSCKVVDKFLLELENQLHEKKVDAVVHAGAARQFLAKKGFDPQMGARPMARLIQDTIRKALADELLFGRLVNGGQVTIDVDDDDKVRLVFEETPEPAAIA